MKKVKGIRCSILRDNYTSKSNLCNDVKEVTLISSEDFKVDGVFEPDETAPAVVLVKKTIYAGKQEIIYAVPLAIVQGKKHFMFGGSFIYSHDSRFPFNFAVKLHDRVEG